MEKKTTVLELSSNDAHNYFMKPANYCTLSLPKYIDFDPILKYVENTINEAINHQQDEDPLDSICAICENKKQRPGSHENVNHTILINKDAKYAFRPIQLPNPYIYYILVQKITEEPMWGFIKKRMEYFYHEVENRIEVSSIPLKEEDREGESQTAASILNWWDNIEQRTIELSMEYKYMLVTDITNCYGSIYTHTIEWALMGKEKAKERHKECKKRSGVSDLNNTDKLGCLIDKYIQSMQYGQTNGLPQGSTLFDFIAEIILGYADQNLDKELKKEGISNYKILRYRDDYRIFSNSKDELEKISLSLQKILSDLNFHMNSSKTKMTENIVEDAIKQDKLYYISNIPAYKKKRSLFSSFQKELYYILSIARKFPNSGIVCRLMNNLNHRIEKVSLREESTDENKKGKKTIDENPKVLIAIIMEIVMNSPRIYQHALSSVSHSINLFSSEKEKAQTTVAVRKKLCRLPNIGHIQLWMQRITSKIDTGDDESYDELLCKIIQEQIERHTSSKDRTIWKAQNGTQIASEMENLWNLEWVKEEYRKDFPIASIFNKKEFDEMKPFIKSDEIDIFNPYPSLS